MKHAVKQHINPINRDLLILIFTGMFLAVTFVTAAILLVSQL